MSDAMIIGLTSSFGIMLGAIITILSSIWTIKENNKHNVKKLEREHKNKIEYLEKEIFFKKKIEYFEETLKWASEKVDTIDKKHEKIKKNYLDAKIFLEKTNKEKSTWEILGKAPLYIANITEITQEITKLIKIEVDFIKNVNKITKLNHKKIIQENEEIVEKLNPQLLSLIRKMEEELKIN